jgi:hypothetical protein
MFVIVCFVYDHMNRSESGILILLSRNVTLSKIVRLLFITTSVSCCSISTAFHCAFTIVYTFVACYSFNCTSVDSFSSCITMFSSLVSFYNVCASTK